jgi:phosphatidyl-myo-inositol alpha-mannosyltransferase
MTDRHTRALRIAMTSYYLPSGSKIGVGYQVHALADGLTRRGHQVTVFSGCPPVADAEYATVQLPSPSSMRTFAFALSLRRLDLSRFDVLHAHGDDYWLWRRRAAAHIRTMHGSCFAEALTISGSKEKLRMVALGLGETLASVVADRTVLISPHTGRWMPWVTSVIPNGVDERIYYPSTARAESPTVLFVGTYQNRKRGKLLMDVFSREVLPRVPEARLVMVCSDAPAASGVTVTGRVDEPTLADLYRRAWVFCLPSTYEGFGIPYAEALASGTPVVATNNPGARYVLADGRFGDIVQDDHLGETLCHLLTSETARADGRTRALARASDFGLSRVLDAYEAVYAEVLSERGDLARA